MIEMSEFLCPVQGVICWGAQKMIRKTIGAPSACGGGEAGDDLHKLKQANCCRFRPHSQRLNCLSSALWIKHLYCTESMKKNEFNYETLLMKITHLTPLFDSYGKMRADEELSKRRQQKGFHEFLVFMLSNFLRFVSYLRRTCRDCVWHGRSTRPASATQQATHEGFKCHTHPSNLLKRERDAEVFKSN